MSNLPIELECAKAQKQRDHYAQAYGAEVAKSSTLTAEREAMVRWIRRAHDACADPSRPRQSVGEMLHAWLEKFCPAVIEAQSSGSWMCSCGLTSASPKCPHCGKPKPTEAAR